MHHTLAHSQYAKSYFLYRPNFRLHAPKRPLFIQYRFTSHFPCIRTLNPKNLTEYDFRDISGRPSVRPLGNWTLRFRYAAEPSKLGSVNYPNQSTGFFYYWTHPDLSPTGGQLRFRLTPTNDPLLFDSGSDLRKPNGIPWAIPVGRLFGLRDNPYAQMLLDDGLVSEDFIHSKYFRIYQKLRLGVHSVVLESSDDVFPLALPCQHKALHMSSSQGVKRIQLYLDDQSWVEDLKLVELGKKVYAHGRLRLSDNSKHPELQITRIFSPSGEQLDSEFPLIQTLQCRGLEAFRSWYLQTTKESRGRTRYCSHTYPAEGS